MSNNNSLNKYELLLDHAMGYNGSTPKSTLLHPNLKNYIYIAGSVIIIAELNDPDYQRFLRGHDEEVTCVALSNNGQLLASIIY